MKNFIKLIFSASIIIILFLFIFGKFQNHIFFNGEYFKSQWINKIKDEKFDLVVIGNSRGALFDFDSTDLNYKNLSEDGSALKTTYLQLYLFYKNNNYTDHVILEGDLYSLHLIDDSKRSPRWIPYFNDKNIYETLVDEHSIFKSYKFLPSLTYLNFKYDWNFLSLLNNLFKIKESPWGENGHMHNCREFRDEAPVGRDEFDLFKPQWHWIDKIIDLTKTHNSRFTLITTPYYKMDDPTNLNTIFLDEISKRKIRYLDHSRVFYNDRELFLDNRHLNCNGVKKYHDNFNDLILD